MNFSISATFPDQLAINPVPSLAAASNPRTPLPSVDTVELSQGAQVHRLKTQGQNVSQIASNLGISLASVNADLGIVASTASIAVAPIARAVTSQPVVAAQK